VRHLEMVAGSDLAGFLSFRGQIIGDVA
jgi:hypothetical protein